MIWYKDNRGLITTAKLLSAALGNNSMSNGKCDRLLQGCYIYQLKLHLLRKDQALVANGTLTRPTNCQLSAYVTAYEGKTNIWAGEIVEDRASSSEKRTLLPFASSADPTIANFIGWGSVPRIILSPVERGHRLWQTKEGTGIALQTLKTYIELGWWHQLSLDEGVIPCFTIR